MSFTHTFSTERPSNSTTMSTHLWSYPASVFAILSRISSMLPSTVKWRRKITISTLRLSTQLLTSLSTEFSIKLKMKTSSGRAICAIGLTDSIDWFSSINLNVWRSLKSSSLRPAERCALVWSLESGSTLTTSLMYDCQLTDQEWCMASRVAPGCNLAEKFTSTSTSLMERLNLLPSMSPSTGKMNTESSDFQTGCSV